MKRRSINVLLLSSPTRKQTAADDSYFIRLQFVLWGIKAQVYSSELPLPAYREWAFEQKLANNASLLDAVDLIVTAGDMSSNSLAIRAKEVWKPIIPIEELGKTSLEFDGF